jgi:hypothetical protein
MARRVCTGIVLCSLLALWSAGSLPAALAGPRPAESSAAPFGWFLTPTEADGYSRLIGVSATDSRHVWAVGSGRGVALIERLGTNGFAIQASPDPGGIGSTLDGAAGTGGHDVWAVGTVFAASLRTLTEHWDGTSWAIVPSPNPNRPGDDFLEGVAAIASDDAWAVGGRNRPSGAGLSSGAGPSAQRTGSAPGGTTGAGSDAPLALHWEGQAWNDSPVQSPTGGGELEAVSATGSNDVWAVGDRFENGGFRALVEHWDGSGWTIVPGAGVAGTTASLTSVVARGPGDVWVTGWYVTDPQQGLTHSLVQHWDGLGWTTTPTPKVGDADALFGLAPEGSQLLHAVGWSRSADFGLQTLAERWDGNSWQVEPTQNPSGAQAVLHGIAGTSTAMWAVGSRLLDVNVRPLAERNCLVCG